MRHAPILLLVLVLTACGAGSRAASSGANRCATLAQPTPGQRTERAPTRRLDVRKTYDVAMETNCGSFTVRLDPRQSPYAAASFVKLAKEGYFDRTIFDRIVPGVLIQGGDPTGTGNGGPGYTTVDKPPANATYDRGTVAMVKVRGQTRGAAGSQFFVVTAVETRLRPDYAIIGTVIK